MWTGQRCDAANKLYHFWARSYDPELGGSCRRMSRGQRRRSMSPCLTARGRRYRRRKSTAATSYTDGLNLFLYVGANPVNLRDPFGCQAGRRGR